MEFVKTTCNFDNRPEYPLQVLATRYGHQDARDTLADADGYTLILLHATGMHKETWEVMIEKLLSRVSSGNGTSRPVKIREIFSIESPNHGESAMLNEETLKRAYENEWQIAEYSRAVHAFLTAGPTKGCKVDFSKRKLIGIGHSSGVPALCLMREYHPRINFTSIISIEAGISLKGDSRTALVSRSLNSWTWLRRDTWSSLEAARKELESSPLYGGFDERVLDSYMKHALREHPAAKFKSPFDFKGFTTALTREQEAASYRSDDLLDMGLDAFSKTTREIPVHLIWSTNSDVAVPDLQSVLEDRTAGRFPASITHLEGAGHLVVQQEPERVAEVVFDVLKRVGEGGRKQVRPRL